MLTAADSQPSLLTGPNVQHITITPGVGRITGWAEYEEVLDVNLIVVTRLGTSMDNTRTSAPKRVIMAETEHFWDEGDQVASALF